jgi:hypothetical protein
MNLIAKLLALGIFHGGRTLKRHGVLLAIVGMMQLLSSGLTVLVLRGSGRAARDSGSLTYVSDPSVAATFITANGTTAQNWNIGGPNGPNWTNSSGTSSISASVSMSVDAPTANLGPTTATTVNVGNNTSHEPTINIGDQSGSSTNTINIGSISGAPTINIQSGQNVPAGFGLNILSASFNLNQNGFLASDFLILGNASGNAGTFSPTGFQGSTNSLFSAPGQDIVLDGAEVFVGLAATEVTLGQLTTASTNIDGETLDITGTTGVTVLAGSGGSQITALNVSGSSGDSLILGPNSPASSQARLEPLSLQLGAALITGGSAGVLSLDGTPVVIGGNPGNTISWPHNTITFACGTGGTQTISAGITGGDVTSGTLSSNCILDFSTNASNQITMLNMAGAIPGSTFGIEFKNGTATKTFLSTSAIAGTLAIVWTWGANTLAVLY